MHLVCPHCQNPIEVVESPAPAEIVCPSCGSSFRLEGQSTKGASLRPGQRDLGKFELLDIVGVGAFGTVYKARDPELDRIVAIKVPRAGNLGSQEDADRFIREARSVAQLRHPSIVSVHEVGEVDRLPYLVSDFVQGVTLADLLSARRPGFRDAAQLIAAVADALQYAHDQGVIHRDVKPSNIMLSGGPDTPVGQYVPHIMDFGLAKREAGEITMTMDGQVLGTPAYMSPEQARGEAHAVDGRSDVYSLGVILYQMLTGELPFRGTTRMLLHQVLHDEPRPPRSLNDRIPRDLQTICLKAMAKELARRYATAAALADDLRRFLRGEAIRARPVGGAERLWRWSKRNPLVAGLTAAVFVLLVAVAGIASVGYVQTRLALGREAAEHQEAVKEKAAAEKAEQETRRQWYAATINLAQQAWDNNDIPRLRALLAETEAYSDRGFEWYYWQRMCHLDLQTLIGHGAGVLSVSWSPDGKRLATGSEDGTAKVWEEPAGRQLLTLKAHAGGVRSVAWSPDGKRLATASSDGTAKVWEAAQGKKLFALKGHEYVVGSVSWSPDGQRLATGSADRTAKV